MSLRKKVENRLQIFERNKKLDELERENVCPLSIQMAEDGYRFFENAKDTLYEIGYIPNSFYEPYKYSGLDIRLKSRLKREFKEIFGKGVPYTPKKFSQKDNRFKKWYVHSKNYIKQQMELFASEYFATILVNWWIRDWVVSLEDFSNSITSLNRKGVGVWEKSKGWIEKRNEYIKTHSPSRKPTGSRDKMLLRNRPNFS